MTPIGLGLTMLIQGGSTAMDAADATGTAPSQVVYHVPPASQAPAAPSDAAQQDTVTLSGDSPAAQTASQNFIPAAAFTLLTHEFTFPPDTSADGANTPAAGNSTTEAASANQAVETQQSAPATFTPGSVTATAVAVATAGAQPATGSNAANAAGNNANSAGAASGSVMVPEETLQQLDQELQRLGINPQAISLMNRMSLLLWVNDPLALRQFVQGMQPSAIGSQANSATDQANAKTNVAQSASGVATNSSEGAGVAAIQSGSASQAASQNQSAVSTQSQLQLPSQQVIQNSSGLQSGGSNDGSAGLSNTPQQQNTTAALQLQELHASLAEAGQAAQDTFPGDPNQQAQGQYVNISA